jgi:hypothetical protein
MRRVGVFPWIIGLSYQHDVEHCMWCQVSLELGAKIETQNRQAVSLSIFTLTRTTGFGGQRN